MDLRIIEVWKSEVEIRELPLSFNGAKDQEKDLIFDDLLSLHLETFQVKISIWKESNITSCIYPYKVLLIKKKKYPYKVSFVSLN